MPKRVLVTHKVQAFQVNFDVPPPIGDNPAVGVYRTGIFLPPLSQAIPGIGGGGITIAQFTPLNVQIGGNLSIGWTGNLSGIWQTAFPSAPALSPAFQVEVLFSIIGMPVLGGKAVILIQYFNMALP